MHQSIVHLVVQYDDGFARATIKSGLQTATDHGHRVVVLLRKIDA